MAVRYDSGMAGGFSFPISTPQRQFMIFEDFVGSVNLEGDEQVQIDTVTSGSAAKDITVHGGAILFDSGGTGGAGHGINAQFKDGIILDEAGDLFFEARVRFAATAGSEDFTDQMFIGLAASDTTLIASEILSNTALVGFASCASHASDVAAPTAGHMSLIADNTSVAATGSLDVAKIDTAANSGVGVDDFVRLAMVIRNGQVQAFVNGEKVGSALTTLPTSQVLLPTFVCETDGTDQGKFLVDYFLVSCGRSSTAL
mgnify:CR=1 FL=1